ncbi:MAG: IPT/TIG domain-containing protein [Ferruginibacter sp.]
MKRNLENYAKKLLPMIVIAVTAIISPAFGQVPAPDFDTYPMQVSPDQQLRFRLPNNIRSGDMITGTVMEEKKDNAGGMKKNAATLEGMVIEIDGKQTKLSNRIFSFLVPAGITSIPFLLKNAEGQIIEYGQIPVFSQSVNNIQNIVNGMNFNPDVICQPGEPLNIHGNFDGNATNTKVTINNIPCEIIAESPRQTIVEIPQNTVAGKATIKIEEQNKKEEHTVNVAVINLSAKKTNLLKGEKTTIRVTVAGLENLDLNNNNFTVELTNQSPQIIAFTKESRNTITKIIEQSSIKQGKFEFTTGIIATTSGSFVVGAILFKPVSKNPCVDAYYDCVKNADEEYEANAKKCTGNANGIIKYAAKCLAPYINDREVKKAGCLQVLINCMKNK